MDNKKEMPMGKKAKMDNLKALRKLAMDMIRDNSEMPEDSMSKVMVAAHDKEGLEKGLDKAKDVLDEMPESEDEESPEQEASESESEESDEDLMAQLEAFKAKIEAKKQRK